MSCRKLSTMKVLIGYDGSDCARGAIRELARAGLPRDVRALVVAAADVPPAPIASGYVPAIGPDPGTTLLPQAVLEASRLRDAEAEWARYACAAGAEYVAHTFPAWRVQSEWTADGAPYWQVVQKAREWGADLVVVGSHGRSAVGRMVLGSVSQNVLAHAPCSVRVARPRDVDVRTAGAPLRLILAVDGSPDSAAAAEAVAARAWPAGTEVRIATVADARLSIGLAHAVPWWAGDRHDGRSPVERMVRAVGESFRGLPLVPSPVVLEGDPKHVLLREAERWGADCIFLGARGHGRLERFLLGSVSASVAARAACSVEVVRPQEVV